VGERFSLVTNAAWMDGPRVRRTVPHWLRVFGHAVAELVIVVDRIPPSGRIAAMHGEPSESAYKDLLSALEEVRSLDGRIRLTDLVVGDHANSLAARWFRWGVPVRCQSGTPILAFCQAIEEAASDIVLRCDCDMLFCERGWLARGIARLREGGMDIVEPPRLGGPATRGFQISTRAMLLQNARFRDRILPIPPHRVDFLRRIYRKMQGRLSWYALEEMLDIERQNGRLRHEVLAEQEDGISMHVPTGEEMIGRGFKEVISAVEVGDIPSAQREAGWNFQAAAWGEPEFSS
jgi:hypothetical protein